MKPILSRRTSVRASSDSLGERFASDLNVTRCGPIQPSDEVQERRLAGAGWADDRHHLASRNRQADVVERDNPVLALEALRDPVELNHPVEVIGLFRQKMQFVDGKRAYRRFSS